MKQIITILKPTLSFRFIKYCIVGTITTLEGWAIVYVLTDYVGLWYIHSSMVGTPIVMITAFFLNHIWTWCDKNAGGTSIEK